VIYNKNKEIKMARVSKRDLDQAVSQIQKIAKALMQNLDDYQAAKKADKDVSKFVKLAGDLTKSKQNWVKHMDDVMSQLDKDVELVIDESLELNVSTFKKMKTFESFVSEEDSEEEVVSTEDKYKVADKLNECYNEAVNEAKEWADDVHDNHTVVSYMEENAALVAALAVNALKKCSEQTPEQLEGALNTLKDSYSKKIEEMKEMEGAEVVESKETVVK
jgi:DNA polymerase III delta prime subunit